MIDLRGPTPLLRVFDLPSSIAFYRNLLGFELVGASGPEYRPGWALLQRGGVELMLNGEHDPAERADSRDASRVAAHEDTVLYFGARDLDAAYAFLVASGVEVAEPMMTGYGFRSVYFRDLDGYGIVFHWPATDAARAEWSRRYGAP